MLVYRRCDESDADETHHSVRAKQIADTQFEGIGNKTTGKGIGDKASLEEYQDIQQLIQLREQEISDPEQYDNFDQRQTRYQPDDGFENLVQSLSTCLDEYLIPYTLAAFDEYEDRFEEYRKQADDLKQQIEQQRDEGHEDSEIAELEVELGNLRGEYS